MGNASTKESRAGDASHRGHHGQTSVAGDTGSGVALHADRSSNRRNRVSRGDLGGILGLGPSGSSEQPQERRETKQEREARRAERERVARIAERERSIKEEHVDGGYLVTMGTYSSPEDFNKQIVRQLQIERKLAPFWRGLNDFSEQWAEHQIIAAARGLPVPPADQAPPEDLIPRPMTAISQATSNLDSLMVPMGDRTQSVSSDQAMSNPGSALPSPGQNPRASSPFKPRGKAIAAVLGGNSRNGSTADIMPREIRLPNDPFVNGQPLEVFLYKDATECPICFLTFPPYLNHTRCCDQPICSECFVQIKRPDPHFPEGHNENDPNHNPEEAAGLLVSEPACCPYCTQPDFGVTYEPPPFRRGLAFSISPIALGTAGTAMSSSSSINSATLSLPTGRRRNQSLSASSPNVILTDRIRPEWASKLQAARAHQARRAAAATALHTAAFLMGNTENRTLRTRFGRRNTSGSGTAPSPSVGGATNGEADNGDSGSGTPSQQSGPERVAGAVRGTSGASGRRRDRLDDLEEMMFAEAVRLSLAAEEERKRKADKEERKEAKKREKEERKAAKNAAKYAGPYEGSGRSGQSSASGSSLSLPGLGFGRKRGNSAASNLRIEASVSNAMTTADAPDGSIKDKGKAVERSASTTTDSISTSTTDAATTTISTTTSPPPPPHPHLPAGPSHLRQMSNASSVTSSILDFNNSNSQHGSYTTPSPSNLQDPRASGLSLGSRSGASEDGGGELERERDRDPSASTEPMFNFRSLAEVVGVEVVEDVAKKQTVVKGTKRKEGLQPATAASGGLAPPTVTVTPDTPAADDDSKQLGCETAVERVHQATQ
ncbi:SNF1-interacting protein [Collariella sp. IMI 366227]|nr:SNF1-interacting protein [Collariella sp. IMI 366227]